MATTRSSGDARFYPRPRLVEAYGGRTWEIVSDEEVAPEGTISVAGTRMTRYFEIRDTTSGRVVRAGRGEIKRYCTVVNPDKLTRR